MSDLIVFYDADDGLMRGTYRRISGVDEYVGVTGGPFGLRSELDRLLKDGKVFARAVFHTHGFEGGISFGHGNNRWLTPQFLRENFAGRGYERIFPYPARIYFNGCKVAKGEKGWDFLGVAGAIFLRSLGGYTFAHTSNGYPLIPFAVMAFGGILGIVIGGSMLGHDPHVSGDAHYVQIGAGGLVLGRTSTGD